MQCDEARELLSPYLDGELSPEQRLKVESHLGDCSGCSTDLRDFGAISSFAARMADPIPPSDLWERVSDGMVGSEPAADSSRESTSRSRRKVLSVVVAAILLTGVGLTFALLHWNGTHHDTVDLDQYLTEFSADPSTAQDNLISQFKNQKVDVREAATQVRYQPVAAGRLPDGVSVKTIRVFEMPCCRCLQTVCKIDEKQTIVIFEHDDEHSFQFGRRSSSMCQCKGCKTRIVRFNGQMVASWSKGKRHLTIVGARDLDQVAQFVERLE